MTKTQLSNNFLKHTSRNPFQRLLINNFYKSLISLAKSLEAKTVLDAGCGEGFSLNRLSHSSIGNKLEGIESSKEAISLGKKLFPNLSLRIGTIYALPYKNNSFDLVVCTEVLEHLENPSKALNEILRVSKKYAILSVPNEPFFMIGNLLRGKNISRWGNDLGHINHWTIFSLKGFIRKHNIKIKTIKLPFPWIMALVDKQQ